MIIVDFVKLDVYRSCTHQEKREVLDAFWRSRVHPSARINQAAREYGPYAVVCLVVVAAELALLILVSINRGYVMGWLAGLAEAAVVGSLWWSVVRVGRLSAKLASTSPAEPAPPRD